MHRPRNGWMSRNTRGLGTTLLTLDLIRLKSKKFPWRVEETLFKTWFGGTILKRNKEKLKGRMFFIYIFDLKYQSRLKAQNPPSTHKKKPVKWACFIAFPFTSLPFSFSQEQFHSQEPDRCSSLLKKKKMRNLVRTWKHFRFDSQNRAAAVDSSGDSLLAKAHETVVERLKFLKIQELEMNLALLRSPRPPPDYLGVAREKSVGVAREKSFGRRAFEFVTTSFFGGGISHYCFAYRSNVAQNKANEKIDTKLNKIADVVKALDLHDESARERDESAREREAFRARMSFMMVGFIYFCLLKN